MSIQFRLWYRTELTPPRTRALQVLGRVMGHPLRWCVRSVEAAARTTVVHIGWLGAGQKDIRRLTPALEAPTRTFSDLLDLQRR